jgi:hypothetical protein
MQYHIHTWRVAITAAAPSSKVALQALGIGLRFLIAVKVKV